MSNVNHENFNVSPNFAILRFIINVANPCLSKENTHILKKGPLAVVATKTFDCCSQRGKAGGAQFLQNLCTDLLKATKRLAFLPDLARVLERAS